MKGGKREVAKHNVEFRLFNPKEKEIRDWLISEWGGDQNMNAAILEVLRVAHFLINYQPNIVINVSPGYPDAQPQPKQYTQDHYMQPQIGNTGNDHDWKDPDIIEDMSLDDGVFSSSSIGEIEDDEELIDPFKE